MAKHSLKVRWVQRYLVALLTPEGARCLSSIFIPFRTKGKDLSRCQRAGVLCHGAPLQLPASWEAAPQILEMGHLGKQGPPMNLDKIPIGKAEEGIEGVGWPCSTLVLQLPRIPHLSSGEQPWVG